MSGQDKPSQDMTGNEASKLNIDERFRDDWFERAKKGLPGQKDGGPVFLPDYMSPQSPWDSPWTPIPTPPDRSKPGPGKVPDGQPLPVPGDTTTPKLPDLSTKPEAESVATKLSREALVIGGGVGQSFFYGVANLPEHLPQIGTSIVLGGTLAAMSKSGKLGAGAAMVVGAYFASRFILDSVNDKRRWTRFADAVSDTWQSDANTWKNMHTVRDTVGNYTFDTSLSLASGYVGYKNPQLGQWILQLLRIPPITPGAPPPFNPRWTTSGMYMQIMPPAGFYRRYGDHSAFGDSGWSIDIHGEIRRTPDRITRIPGFKDNDYRASDSDYNPYEYNYRKQMQERDKGREHREERREQNGHDGKEREQKERKQKELEERERKKH